jgi:hypothetical protein
MPEHNRPEINMQERGANRTPGISADRISKKKKTSSCASIAVNIDNYGSCESYYMIHIRMQA